MTHIYQDGSDDPLPVNLRVSVLNATVTAEPATGRVNLPPRIKLFLEVLMVVMCLGAVAGNVLVIGIVAATKNFHSVTSVLITNLAISDLLVGVGVMPFVAVSIMNNGWVDVTTLCLYVGYTASVYCTVSVLTLAAIALDRYCSIMDCLRYGARCTLWRSCSVVLWIWLQALLTSLPPLLGWSSVEYVAPMYSCAVNWASRPSYTAFMAFLSFLLPAAVILFCYVHIVRVARGHARRIHTLEEQLQRSRGNPLSTSSPSPATLVYHLSGRFVSEIHGGGAASDARLAGQAASDAASTSPADPQAPPASSSTTPPSRLLSLLAQSVPQPLQNQHHHGVLRLFLVISAFFLCWTPYMGVALVQATETALSCKSSLVPPSAVTFSYWLALLNSDINPLLYALLSKRFQGALWCLRQKIGARLGWGAGRGGGGGEGQGGDRGKGRGQRSSDLCTATHTLPPDPASSGEPPSPSCRSHSVFTLNSSFPEGSLCGHYIPASSPPSSSAPSSSLWSGGLQVPSRTPEGSRLPFSAATSERQATFFYGQITVRVEHDVG
ncbi:5-hydroxytryptamine receptor 1D [Osmerus eperlanus]|uniref:5-hydroxytryptamine receptor 1D n=1 Tax=Osmerus eperlanus TaxID=29151 RepID=UPI002E0E2DC1